MQPETYGQTIRRLAEERDTDIQALFEMSGVKLSRLKLFDAGLPPEPDEAFRLCGHLGFPVETLTENANEATRTSLERFANLLRGGKLDPSACRKLFVKYAPRIIDETSFRNFTHPSPLNDPTLIQMLEGEDLSNLDIS